MGSIHFFAVEPEEKLMERSWLEYREPRTLTNQERKDIEKLSNKLEARTYVWMKKVNKSGLWKKYYSDRFHRWSDYLYEEEEEEIEPATELYLYPGIEGLYCTGIGESEEIFFGFMNLDDVECDFNVIHFLREYVLRLSIINPGLLWIFDYDGGTYYRGIPITIKRKSVKYPVRTAPRKDNTPKYVKEALGSVKMLAPDTCPFCKEADGKVTVQYLDKLIHAHETCFLDFYKTVYELDS